MQPSKKSQGRSEKLYLRVTASEAELIQKHADQYAKGNLSEWLRMRGMQPTLDVSIAMQDQEDTKARPQG